ncbi:EAL domain-containing protein [Halarcobacter anaerophilus]|uniref:EAL domain-containing protein n=1 Tax=Halarcobacter anaerophilus TaxID=877500 RepID=UPI000698ED3D|nr:EAL domain-containing protein [Halarcobacter anaerophilus]
MKLPLSKLNFLTLLISALLFSCVTAFFVFKFSNDFYENRVEEIEKKYIQNNKILIKNEVDKVVKRTETLQNLAYKNNKIILKDKIDFLLRVLSSNYSLNKNIEKTINEYKPHLDYYKWDNNTGYIYIFDQKGKILYHGNNKNYISKNIFDIAKNNKELLNLLNEVLKKDDSYGSYLWKKPNIKKDELFKKYVYIKKDKQMDIYIAAGVYKSEVDKKIISTLFDELEVDRFGQNDYGYFWVQNIENKMLLHPISKELVNKDLTNLASKKEKDNKFISEISKKAQKETFGYISYFWQRPDSLKIDEKTSYFHLIKEWDLIVCSGFYLTELKELLKDEKKELKRLLFNNSIKIIGILIILTLITIIIGLYISYKIKRNEKERLENNNMLQQYKMILDATSVVSKSDTKGNILYVNDHFEKISGYKKEVIKNRSYSILRHPGNHKSLFKNLWGTISKGNIWKGIIKNRRKNGETYFSKTTIVPIKDSKGEIIEYISSSTDVTELIENRSKLNDLFKNDPLTGLGNRVSLINHLAKKSKGVLALINIDRFKEINDSFNHKTGDEVIKIFANRLFNYFAEKDCKLYRVQADIIAIYSQNKSKDKIIKELETFMDLNSKKAYEVEDTKFLLTYTCGVASDSENLLTFADIALSEAKNKKVKIKEYDSSMKSIEKFKNNLQWVEKLHKAITEDRIIAHYQPIYNYKTGKIEKYEALMRLVEDDKIIYPNEYLGIAKRTKLYPELTYKMVEKVINKFSNINKEFSLNLSVEDLMNEELMTYIFDFAQQKKIFHKMVLEIVESEEIEDSDYITKLLEKFKEKGCKIAIDDFGSGYSNYDYLIKLQADYIKIDGSIIKHILEDERTQNLVKSIVSFAKKSNMKVIAEFVSSKEIDELLRKLGVDYAQGFYYGKPLEDLI